MEASLLACIAANVFKAGPTKIAQNRHRVILNILISYIVWFCVDVSFLWLLAAEIVHFISFYFNYPLLCIDCDSDTDCKMGETCHWNGKCEPKKPGIFDI